MTTRLKDAGPRLAGTARPEQYGNMNPWEKEPVEDIGKAWIGCPRKVMTGGERILATTLSNPGESLRRAVSPWLEEVGVSD